MGDTKRAAVFKYEIRDNILHMSFADGTQIVNAPFASIGKGSIAEVALMGVKQILGDGGNKGTNAERKSVILRKWAAIQAGTWKNGERLAVSIPDESTFRAARMAGWQKALNDEAAIVVWKAKTQKERDTVAAMPKVIAEKAKLYPTGAEELAAIKKATEAEFA